MEVDLERGGLKVEVEGVSALEKKEKKIVKYLGATHIKYGVVDEHF